MESLDAKVVSVDDKVFIQVGLDSEGIRIPISEDKPIEVKAAFNRILSRLKKGSFSIQLQETGNDLFSQVSNEYIIQLNREIQEVFGEIERYQLTGKLN